MPLRGSKNVRPRYVELPTELDAELEAFAAARGQTFKAVIVEACRRHLAYPPPPPAAQPLAPLPDGPAAGEGGESGGKAAKPRARGKKG